MVLWMSFMPDFPVRMVVLCLLVHAGALSAEVVVGDAWIREAPPNAPVRAGYLEMVNVGTETVRVVSVASERFGAIEIHEMVDRGDGTMRMRPVAAIEVAGGGRVRLAPGGLHLMLFRPQQALAAGDRVDATLVLENGNRIDFQLEQR